MKKASRGRHETFFRREWDEELGGLPRFLDSIYIQPTLTKFLHATFEPLPPPGFALAPWHGRALRPPVW